MNTRAQSPAKLDPATVSEIIEMALSDEVGFTHIEVQYGLRPDEVKALMRANIKPGSYKAWRKRLRAMRDQRGQYK